jgi:hypothetical protein
MRGGRLLTHLSLVVAVAGCAGPQGFDRQAMRELFHHDPDIVTERDITSTLELKAGATAPFRLGLFFVRKPVPTRGMIRRVDWFTADKEALLRRLAPLRDERVLADVFILTDSTVQGVRLRDIRLAGARYGADVVLIVDGVAAVDRYNNGYASLYPTLIGAYFAPGTESEALFMIEGSLWDVRSEFLYGAQVVEALSKTTGPAALVEDRTVIEQAKAAAIEDFGRKIEEKLRLVKEDLARARQGSR